MRRTFDTSLEGKTAPISRRPSDAVVGGSCKVDHSGSCDTKCATEDNSECSEVETYQQKRERGIGRDVRDRRLEQSDEGLCRCSDGRIALSS
jgi:hypothetical protein